MIKIRPHRKFYVNNKLEFALFFNPSITNKEEIIKEFRGSDLWRCFERHYSVKFKSYEFSEDLLRVDITIE